jgi:hypothetical protein
MKKMFIFDGKFDSVLTMIFQLTDIADLSIFNDQNLDGSDYFLERDVWYLVYNICTHTR